MDRHVIVICEECGRKYRVNPERILGRAAGFSCRACGHAIRVVKPTDPPASAEPERVGATPPGAPERPAFRRTGLGLKTTAWLVWFAAPVLLLAGAAGLLVEPAAAPAGAGGEESRQVLLLLAAGLLAVTALGLGFGLRLAGRVARLAAAADRLASGAGEPISAPDSGDDLDRVAAALRDAAEGLRSRRGAAPR